MYQPQAEARAFFCANIRAVDDSTPSGVYEIPAQWDGEAGVWADKRQVPAGKPVNSKAPAMSLSAISRIGADVDDPISSTVAFRTGELLSESKTRPAIEPPPGADCGPASAQRQESASKAILLQTGNVLRVFEHDFPAVRGNHVNIAEHPPIGILNRTR